MLHVGHRLTSSICLTRQLLQTNKIKCKDNIFKNYRSKHVIDLNTGLDCTEEYWHRIIIKISIITIHNFLKKCYSAAQGGYSGFQVTGMIEGFFWV